MASVASQLIEEVTAQEQSAVSRMRERYAQTVLTFRLTYVYRLTEPKMIYNVNIISHSLCTH